MDRGCNLLHYPNMQGVPTYALYGEADSARQQDWLHWETIQSRSRLHGYRIAPHRHERFFQILSLTGGGGHATLDGTGFDLEPPVVVVVPALTVVERRIALEARRQLLFSTLTIKQIGAGLGYDDPAYFTRVLKRVK